MLLGCSLVTCQSNMPPCAFDEKPKPLRRSSNVSKITAKWSLLYMLLASRRMSLVTRRDAIGLPQPCGHVDVGVVEEHPDLGLLGGGLALERLLLDEVAERLHVAVRSLLQHTVHDDGGRHAEGPDRRQAVAVTDDDFGQFRCLREGRDRAEEHRAQDEPEPGDVDAVNHDYQEKAGLNSTGNRCPPSEGVCTRVLRPGPGALVPILSHY